MARSLPDLDRGADTTLAEQIARFYGLAIEEGRLRPGDRLPTIRDVSEHGSVTRATVQQGYRLLAERGLVAGTVGRGTQVLASPGHRRSLASPLAAAAWRQLQSLHQMPRLAEGSKVVADFSAIVPDASFFPVDDFRKSMDRVLGERGRELLVYGDPAGSLALRRFIAERDEPDGKQGSADCVLITSGAQQGIDLTLRVFTSPGDAVAVTIPTYQHLFGSLKGLGLELIPVASGQDGVNLDDLRRVLSRNSVKLFYVMPTFHNPTGRSLNLEQRQQLMEVVCDTCVPVLEDEFERDLRFAGEPLPFLRSLDPRALTTTVRSFSKGLFPGVRIGWVHASPEVIGLMGALKRFTALETSPLLQASLLDFVQGGAMASYLQELREALRRRHELAQDCLHRSLPEAHATKPEGGFSFWLELPEGIDGDACAELAAHHGVLVTPGRMFDPEDRPCCALRISLSRAGENELRAGIDILARCVKELRDRSRASQPPLFL